MAWRSDILPPPGKFPTHSSNARAVTDSVSGSGRRGCVLSRASTAPVSDSGFGRHARDSTPDLPKRPTLIGSRSGRESSHGSTRGRSPCILCSLAACRIKIVVDIVPALGYSLPQGVQQLFGQAPLIKKLLETGRISGDLADLCL